MSFGSSMADGGLKLQTPTVHRVAKATPALDSGGRNRFSLPGRTTASERVMQQGQKRASPTESILSTPIMMHGMRVGGADRDSYGRAECTGEVRRSEFRGSISSVLLA